jgi:uncharacterized protein YuzE
LPASSGLAIFHGEGFKKRKEKECTMVVGSGKHFTWDYSEGSDILNIRKAHKKTEGGAELGDFTVDFDKNGNVVGIEIMNASEFFGQVGITKEQLEHLKEAELTVTQRDKRYMIIWVKVILPQNIERKIPVPAPIMMEPVAAVA